MAEVYYTTRDMQFHGHPAEDYAGPVGFFTIPAGTRCTRAKVTGIVGQRLAEMEAKDHDHRTFLAVRLEGMIRYIADENLTTEAPHAVRQPPAPEARPTPRPSAIARSALAALAKKSRGRVDPGDGHG